MGSTSPMAPAAACWDCSSQFLAGYMLEVWRSVRNLGLIKHQLMRSAGGVGPRVRKGKGTAFGNASTHDIFILNLFYQGGPVQGKVFDREGCVWWRTGREKEKAIQKMM